MRAASIAGGRFSSGSMYWPALATEFSFRLDGELYEFWPGGNPEPEAAASEIAAGVAMPPTRKDAGLPIDAGEETHEGRAIVAAHLAGLAWPTVALFLRRCAAWAWK
jgi:hypothetical protein